jgi:hypothetical protein
MPRLASTPRTAGWPRWGGHWSNAWNKCWTLGAPPPAHPWAYVGCPFFAWIFSPLHAKWKQNAVRFAWFALQFAKQITFSLHFASFFFASFRIFGIIFEFFASFLLVLEANFPIVF